MTLVYETLLACPDPLAGAGRRAAGLRLGRELPGGAGTGQVPAGPGSVRPGARLGDAPKRVESRRPWAGSAPDLVPQESGVRVTLEAFTD